MAENIITQQSQLSTAFPQAAEKLLKEGQSIRFSAAGNSMHPTIKQDDTLIIEPCDPADLPVGDIALYRDGDRLFAHRIIRIYTQKWSESTVFALNYQASRAESPLLESCCKQDALKAQRSLGDTEGDAPKAQRSTKRKNLRFVFRGDFRPNPDPIVTAPQILGKIIAVERKNQIFSPYGRGKRLIAGAYRLASQLKSHLPA